MIKATIRDYPYPGLPGTIYSAGVHIDHTFHGLASDVDAATAYALESISRRLVDGVTDDFGSKLKDALRTAEGAMYSSPNPSGALLRILSDLHRGWIVMSRSQVVLESAPKPNRGPKCED